MKIIPLLTAVSIILGSFCISASADEIINMNDFSGRLTDMEAERLEDILDRSSAESGFTLSAVITDNLEEKTASEYAEQFYNDNFKNYSQSIILLINYDTNNDIIYTGEYAGKYFTDDIKKQIIDECVSPNITDGHVSEAVSEFAEKVIEISESIPAVTQPAPEQNNEPEEKDTTALTVIFGIIAGALCGTVTALYIKSLYKRTENDLAVSNHKCSHTVDFNVKEDKFRREFVNKSDTSSQT